MTKAAIAAAVLALYSAAGWAQTAAENAAAIADETTARTAADTALGDRVTTNANNIATETTNREAADATLTTNVQTNANDIANINDRLRGRKTRRADGRTRLAADGSDRAAVPREAVASLHATGANDPAGEQSEVTVSKSEVAITRGDGKVVFDADNDAKGETTLRGGTGTTIQILRDQYKGVAAGTGQRGVNYQTTMYGAGGNNDAEYTTTQAAFDAFTNGNGLPADAPAGATGIINEGGVYKYVTNVRIGGVAAGVKANDAVNKGQLDSAVTGLGRCIDTNTRAIEGNTQGIANVTAMASMPALPVGADSGFSAGVGGFNGKNAIAIGFQHRLSANTTFKVAAATGSNGKPTMGAGISYSWGGSSYNVASQTVAMQDVNAMQDRLRA